MKTMTHHQMLLSIAIGGVVGVLVAYRYGLLVACIVAIPCVLLAICRYWCIGVFVWLGVFLAVGDRIVVRLAIAGRGIVPLAQICTILLACLGVLLYSRRLPIYRSRFMGVEIAYLIVSCAMPIMAPVLRGYPVHTMASSLSYLASGSFMVCGFLVGSQGGVPRRLYRSLLVSTCVHLAYAIGQSLVYNGTVSGRPWDLISRWDQAMSHTYNTYFVTGRSSGLFMNPNALGYYAATVIVFALYSEFSRTQRVSLCVAASVLLVLSQSRGAAVALVLVLVSRILTNKGVRMRSILPTALVVLVMLTTLWLVAGSGGVTSRTLLERTQRMLDPVTKPIWYEENLMGRIRFWTNALEYFASHPLGTLGSPELMVGTSVDNDWLRHLVQGGVLYLSMFVLLLAGTVMKARGSTWSPVVRAQSWLIALVSLTQIPMTSNTTMATFWFLVGLVSAGQQKHFLQIQE